MPLAVVEEAARPLRQVVLTTALALTLAVPLTLAPALTLALAPPLTLALTLISCSTILAPSRRRSSWEVTLTLTLILTLILTLALTLAANPTLTPTLTMTLALTPTLTLTLTQGGRDNNAGAAKLVLPLTPVHHGVVQVLLHRSDEVAKQWKAKHAWHVQAHRHQLQ